MGLDHPDDAAVWRLDDERALIVTTDFFTPVVDDPYDYGAIAAANALSDVYAMGGRPFLALNIAALPPDLPPEISGAILRGGAEKARQAGVALVGGHTIQDKEPKYGLVVLGLAHPDHLLTKDGARPGDVLVLSKPLGFGVLTTALKRGLADPADVAEVVRWMARLNRQAAELALEFDLQGGTDITGFGLLGHGLEMAMASQVRLHLQFGQIPLLPGVQRYASEWIFPGGASDNRLYFGANIEFAADLDEVSRMLLFDPQTSGGLLLAVPHQKLPALQQRAVEMEQSLWVIGEVLPGQGIEVVV